MTPQARLSAAIEVLDRILAGAAAEQALTNWGRASRFAGSGDRHAVRDLVYDALRCKRSFAALGGSETGRGLILGSLRASGQEVAALFTGEGHAPAAVAADEAGEQPQGTAALDCPDWLAAQFQDSLGADFSGVMQAMRKRAPVFLRVNLAKTSRAKAIAALAEDGVRADGSELASACLIVLENPRKINASRAYLDGLVELQDASSQAVIDTLALVDGKRVLDYCCGGGGKALAMAAKARISLSAHDRDLRRMRDLPARATRAGALVHIVENPATAVPYDLVLTDVPCSGSGSWRRDPQGKWALTAARLAEVLTLQAEILDQAASLLAPNGMLAYATCSMLRAENEAQIAAFLQRHSGWSCPLQHRFSPLSGADGFFVAHLCPPAMGG
jgi:16S rRNA (cytosine967-C5)-methyltransferase